MLSTEKLHCPLTVTESTIVNLKSCNKWTSKCQTVLSVTVWMTFSGFYGALCLRQRLLLARLQFIMLSTACCVYFKCCMYSGSIQSWEWQNSSLSMGRCVLRIRLFLAQNFCHHNGLVWSANFSVMLLFCLIEPRMVSFTAFYCIWNLLWLAFKAIVS